MKKIRKEEIRHILINKYQFEEEMLHLSTSFVCLAVFYFISIEKNDLNQSLWASDSTGGCGDSTRTDSAQP